MGEKLSFITKKKNFSQTDVSLSVVGQKEMAVSITLRNCVDRNISSTAHLVVAISGERLYFKEETKEIGYKISSCSSKNTRVVSIKDDALIDFVITHSGDYKLLYDRELKLFYVDTE